MRFKVMSVNEAGSGRVTVSLNSNTGDPNAGPVYTSSLSLNLDSAEADTAGYWPGKEFDVNFTAATTA